MWLALDIGNSAVKGAFFDEDTITHRFRIDVDHSASVSSWNKRLISLCERVTVERIGIVSVVPEFSAEMGQVLSRITDVRPLIFSWQVALPFELAYQTPHTLGMDRLAAAAGAWTRYGLGRPEPVPGVIVVDAGTALTCEVIERTGVYQGGIISPGPRLALRALHEGTAQLPPVNPDLPGRLIGRSTREGIQSGIMYGFIDSVAGMLRRIEEQLGSPTVVVATGGWSDFLKQHVAAIDYVEPDLVLLGIFDLMRLNADRA